MLILLSGDIVGQSGGKVTDDDLVSLCESLHYSKMLAFSEISSCFYARNHK